MKTTIKQRKNLVGTAYSCTFGKLLKVLHPSCGVGTAYSCTETKGHKVLHASKAPLLFAGEGCGSCPIGLTATGEGRKQSAFTLAEVLITLGVVGVVAAVTLPTVMQNYKNHVVETRLQKVYTVVNQAIRQAELVNGEKENWDFDDPQFYEKYFEPYLNVLKREVVSGTSFDYNCIYFNDGSLLIGKASNSKQPDGTIKPNTGLNRDYYFYPYAKNFKEEEVDSRTGAGSIMFPFRFAPYYPLQESYGTRHYKKGFEPYMHNLTDNSYLYNGKTYSCNKTNSTPMFCTALIMINNWKIPKDYPFKVR